MFPSLQTRLAYTDDTDLTDLTDLLNESRPAGGPSWNLCKSAQSVQSVFPHATHDTGTLMTLICPTSPAPLDGHPGNQCKSAQIRPICVPSCHARHGYTDDADLTDLTDLPNESRPAGGPSRNLCKSAQSVQSVFLHATHDTGTLMTLI